MHDLDEEDKSMNKFNSLSLPPQSSRQSSFPLFDAPRHHRQVLSMFLDLFFNPTPSIETKIVSIKRTEPGLELGWVVFEKKGEFASLAADPLARDLALASVRAAPSNPHQGQLLLTSGRHCDLLQAQDLSLRECR